MSEDGGLKTSIKHTKKLFKNGFTGPMPLLKLIIATSPQLDMKISYICAVIRVINKQIRLMGYVCANFGFSIMFGF